MRLLSIVMLGVFLFTGCSAKIVNKNNAISAEHQKINAEKELKELDNKI